MIQEERKKNKMKELMESWRNYTKQILSEDIALGGGKSQSGISFQGSKEREEGEEDGKDALAKAADKTGGDLSDYGVVKIVDFLNSPEGKDPKVRAALRTGQEDAKAKDEVIAVNDNASPDVANLSPTQNEISLSKSIGWPLSSIETLQNVATGDPTGRGMKIVSSGDLVIDGHHRWSSVWSVNPKAKVLAVDVGLPGEDADQKLAVAQLAIAATIDPTSGDVPKATTGGAKDNILGSDAETIKGMITSLVGKKMDSGKPLLGDEYVDTVKKSREGKAYFGLEPNMSNEQARGLIINKVSNNLANLPEPQGPERDYMPQFDGGDTHDKQVSLGNVVARMKAGDVNFKGPFKE
jgi:hypothetical protein